MAAPVKFATASGSVAGSPSVGFNASKKSRRAARTARKKSGGGDTSFNFGANAKKGGKGGGS